MLNFGTILTFQSRFLAISEPFWGHFGVVSDGDGGLRPEVGRPRPKGGRKQGGQSFFSKKSIIFCCFAECLYLCRLLQSLAACATVCN